MPVAWYNPENFDGDKEFLKDRMGNKFFIPANEVILNSMFGVNKETKYNVWLQSPKELAETERWKKIRMLLINSSETIEPLKVRTKTWYHVYAYPKGYGFSVVDGVITNHPEKRFEGIKFDISKAKFEIVKVGEYEI